MRTHIKGLLGVAFLIIGVCFLMSMSCSWDIVTRGEILKADESTLEDLTAEEIETAIESAVLIPTDDIPDSLVFRVFSTIDIDGETYDFVEMEVGELLPGQGSENDTLFVDHRP